MASWAGTPPHLDNLRIHPGIRHPSRLWTAPVPFKLFASPNSAMQMKVVRNHQRVDPQLLILLNNSKNIFSSQLPNMGADYIARLVFDFHAETVMMLYSGVVKGAICSRIFPEERFIEIAFCAVDSTLQSRGCGRLLMNFLKYVIQYSEIYNMLACADNEAVIYFKKLGFNDKAITIDPKRWVGRIKDYDKVTLVHSKIYPEVDYMHFPDHPPPGLPDHRPTPPQP
jgi:histone acetyltransferase